MSKGGNVVALAISEGARVVSALLVQIVLARYLGADGFGAYAFVMGVLGLFAFVSNLNVNVLLARRVAWDHSQARDAVREGFTLVLGLGALCIATTAGYAALRDGRPEVVAAAAVGGLVVTLQSLALVPQSAFDGLRRMRLEVPGMVTGRVVALLAVLVVVGLEGGLVAVFWAQAIGAVVALVLVLWALRGELGAFVPLASPTRVRALLASALPFGLNRFFDAVYLSSDVLLLAEFRDDGEVGLYRVASLGVLQLVIVANVLNRSTYTAIAKVKDDPHAAGEALTFNLRLLVLMSLPVLIGGAVMAEDFVVWLVGVEYAAAALPFALMLPLVPLRYVNNGLGWALSALDAQEQRTRAVAGAAAFNVAANLFAIPLWGLYGAVATSLATDALLTAWHIRMLRGRVRHMRIVGPLARLLAPAVAMGAVVVLCAPLPVPVRILVGAAAYLPLAWASGGWSRDDLGRISRI